MWMWLAAITNLFILASFVALWPDNKIVLVLIEAVLISTLIWLLSKERASRRLIVNKLKDGFDCLQDGDFSISLAVEGPREQQELLNQFNIVIDKLRAERQTIYQRELLLDKMVNASTVVSVLLNNRQQIVYLNHAATKFFDNDKELIGQEWQQAVANKELILSKLPKDHNAIITLQDAEGIEQNWLVSGHDFKLHAAPHKLLLLKPITNELQAQETQVWKKVIRVINHELNNSIAPISSMCHSGTMLASKIENTQLDMVFTTISNRIQKLSEFINSYSRLARISLPKLATVNLVAMLKQVQNLYSFEFRVDEKECKIQADASQLEQVIINLIKNANEATKSSGVVEVELKQTGEQVVLVVRDNGPGMNQEQLRQAFLPSFSTKEGGSGIGLSICKEIVENHLGKIELQNRSTGGLEVILSLPTELTLT